MGIFGRDRGFWLHVSHLFAGTGLAQAINLCAYPVLTRIYEPEDFGLLALITAFSMPLAAAACLGYEPAVVLPENDDRARRFLSLLVVLPVLVCIVLLFIVFVMRAHIAAMVNIPSFGGIVWLVPVATVLLAMNRVYDFWMTRNSRFSLMAGAKVAGASVGAAVKIAWGTMLRAASVGLIVGFVACEVCKLAWALIRLGRRAMPKKPVQTESRQMLAEYAKFPRFNLPYLFLQTLSLYLPVIVFSACFGARMVGLFTVGLRMALLPVELATQSVAQVFYRESVTQMRSEGDMARLMEKTVARLMLIGLIPFSVLAVFGPWGFGLFFGAAWVEAGLYAQILAPALFMQFISAPLTLFNTLGEQKLGFFWQLWFFTATLSALGVGAFIGRAYVAVAILSLAVFLSHFRLAHLNFRLCGAQWRHVFKEMKGTCRNVPGLRRSH